MAETIETITEKLNANTVLATGLQNTVDALQESAGAAFAALSTQVADLQAQLAAGTPVSQAQLDALGAAVDAQAAQLAAITQDVADTPVPVIDTPAEPTP